MIVDDSPLSLKFLAKILLGIGNCSIIEAIDGEDAIGCLRSAGGRVDAIVSDLRMPRMNGLELLREVRLGRTAAPQSIPFFIVTGFAERTLAGLALGLDVDGFLARPVKQHALKGHLIRTTAERRVPKTPAEALAIYGEVDLTLARLPEVDVAVQPEVRAAPVPLAGGTAGASGERLTALENVTAGMILSRDAVNSAGTVLLKAGEEMTAGLKAVLMSYAAIDRSLEKVWVTAPV